MLLRDTSNCPPICVKFGLKGAACAMMASSRFSFLIVEGVRSAYWAISTSSVVLTTCMIYRSKLESLKG